MSIESMLSTLRDTAPRGHEWRVDYAVRCKDCAHYKEDEDFCDVWDTVVPYRKGKNGYGYCSWGEMK